MVDREVDGPVWVVLGRSWGLCVRSWAALGAYVGGLGPVLGSTLAILGRSWASTGGPGPLLEPRSWTARGPYVVCPHCPSGLVTTSILNAPPSQVAL